MPFRNHIEDIFGFYGINIDQSGYKTILYVCPFHPQGTHSHNAVIYTNNGGWNCFNPACDSKGSLVSIVMRMEKVNFETAINFMQDKFGMDIEAMIFEEETTFAREVKYLPLPSFYRELDPLNPYLKRNQFTWANLNKLEVGQAKHDNNLFILPYKHNGQNVGYGMKPWVGRMNFPGGFFVNDYLYGFDNAKEYDEVWVVEGQRDCWRLWEFGLPCVAMNNATCSPRQFNLLIANFTKIHICLDGDFAGAAGACKLFEKLCGLVELDSTLLPQGTDPCDFKDKNSFTSLTTCATIEPIKRYRDLLKRLEGDKSES